MKGLLLLMSMIARFVAAEVFPGDVDEPTKPFVVNITNKKAHVSVLRTYQIECAASGSRPEAVITWWKGNHQVIPWWKENHQVKHTTHIINFSFSPNLTESSLNYVPTMEDDGKYLTCRAENPVIPNSALEDRWRLIVHYPPIVRIKLDSSLKANDINDGDDVYFQCDVQANPEAFVSWYKDGKELHPETTTAIFFPSGRSLVLRSVTRNSAGEYSCAAFNTEGKSTSEPLMLEIMFPMIEVSAVAGMKAELLCDIDPASRSEVVSMVFWYKDGRDGEPIYSLDARGKSIAQAGLWSDPDVFGERATMRTNVKPARLEIDLLEAADAGVYRCRLDYKNSPTRNQKVNLTVIVPPNKPVIYIGAGRSLAKTLQAFNEGSELSLLCEVIGGSPPPKVTWHSEGRMLDNTYTFEHGDTTKNRLDILNVTREFLGARLICRASNTNLISDLTAEITLDINLKPLVVNITNKQEYLSALKTYDIKCATSGSKPKAVITWWKGNDQVKHMARTNVTESVLSYVPTMEDDGKYLTCRAENPVVPDSALEDRWRLVVHYVPIVSIKLGSSLKANDINEGNDVYFECEVQANPKAHNWVIWYKDGKELRRNATAGIYLHSGRSLVLRSVTKNSAGEYSCTASNDEGKSSSKPITLDIMYAPICKEGSSTQVVGALKHETISLVCGVQSKPPPKTFHWTFNNSGELMNVPANRFTHVKPLSLITSHWHGSRLNYTPANDMDYGTVACWAKNRIGVQKTPCLFQIIVAGKPYPLQNCTALQSTGPYAYRMGHEDFKATDSRDADWLIVRCSGGFDGGLPLTNYELEVYSEQNVYHVNTIYLNHTEKSSSSGPVFEVPGLEPGRKYRLHLYAVNAKGRSDPVVLEPVTLKAVAMYTTDRGTSDDSTDYSLLVACFASGVTAVCILIVGITLTLYRRSHPMQSIKAHSKVVQYGNKEHRVVIAPLNKESRDEMKGQTAGDMADDDPDVIPNKMDKRPNVLEANYETAKSDKTKDFSHLEELDYPSPSSVLHTKDSWVYSNGCVEKVEKNLSPLRPSTLPVHRSHDIYTRSLRVQESCI